MSLETRVFDLITTLRRDIRGVQTRVETLESTGGGGGGVTVSPASESVSGILRLATQSEITTGVDDTKAVTPLKFQTRLAVFAQPLSSNLTTLASVVSSALGRSLLSASDAAAAKTALVLTKSDVGLPNVDNTSDVNKPVSSATQTALNLKADQSTVSSLNKASVGLGNVDNTSDVNKPVSTAQAASIATKLGLTAKAADSELLDGLDSTQFLLKGDSPGNAGLNTAGISTPNQRLRSGFYQISASTDMPDTGWWHLQVYAHTNEGNSYFRQIAYAYSDDRIYTRRISSGAATDVAVAGNWTSWEEIVRQSSLNLKANLASPSFTGTPTGPTAAANANSTQLATTAYVDAAAFAASGVMPTEIDGGTP